MHAIALKGKNESGKTATLRRLIRYIVQKTYGAKRPEHDGEDSEILFRYIVKVINEGKVGEEL